MKARDAKYKFLIILSGVKNSIYLKLKGQVHGTVFFNAGRNEQVFCF